MPKRKTDKYLGESFLLRNGVTVKVIDCKGYHNITVMTQDEHRDEILCEVSQLKKGTLKTPHEVTVAGRGFLGGSKYKSRDELGHKTPTYVAWSNMMSRVYRYSNKAYAGVRVDEEWYNFQTYAEWFHSQEGFDVGWDVDKDIIGTGLLYSQTHCILVPRTINNFVSGVYNNLNNFPAGVHKNLNGRYIAQMSNTITGKREGLGYFDTPCEAHRVYKDRKIQHLIEVLESDMCNDISSDLKQVIFSGFCRRLHGD